MAMPDAARRNQRTRGLDDIDFELAHGEIIDGGKALKQPCQRPRRSQLPASTRIRNRG